MSTSTTAPDCQELLTELGRTMPPLASVVQNKIKKGEVAQLSLKMPQLALMAAWLSSTFPSQTIVIPAPSQKTRQFAEMVAGWQSIVAPTHTWHLLVGELTTQEQLGHVTTNLSTALHFLLAGVPNHHFIIPENALGAAVPDQPHYLATHRSIHVGERQNLKTLITALIASGFVRYASSLEPGSIRVRGEQIDIYHPTFAGPYTITLYGNVVESIVGHRGQRSHTRPSLTIPPMVFPAATIQLAQVVSNQVTHQPHHIMLGTRKIIYDALHPDLLFPWKINPTPQQMLSKKTIVVYENLERVRNFVTDHHVSSVKLCRHPLASRPLALSTREATIVTEAAVLPTPATPAPVSYQQGLTLLANLRDGRPAVHADHGIGIYEGLQTRQINGISRDYLILRYAAGDALSVPVEFAHKVTAYLGETTPPLHRLGGTAWATTRKRAAHDAEAFARSLLRTAQARAQRQRDPYYLDAAIEAHLETTFPYSLTPDQEATWAAVRYDLQQSTPMDRLVVGDVGFGKTEIAIRAASHVAAGGRQVAVLAPTTLLVQQHADTFLTRLPHLREQIGVLSRFTSPAAQRAYRKKIAEGSIKIVVGTHALLSKRTQWQALGLVIIDEEQRFGVQHKEHFKKMRANIDVLSLSATPIPRTLSMAMSGIKELSVISTPPEGRKSVATHVGAQNDALISQAIRRELARGGQVYVVAPKIRGLAALGHQVGTLVPQARVAVVHGQLDSASLAGLMEQFDAGTIDVLISSTIIESGLDVPNANTLIVMRATHFGLSELYQLRGRIGRRERQGYAYFLYDQHELTSIERQRLTALTEATRLGSGWTLAQRDLEIRGAGNLLGAEQSGTVNAVGVQLYLDLVHDALGSTSTRLIHRDVEIQLPLPALIPATYIADVAVRTHYYQLLSRASSLEQLQRTRHDIERSFGPFPESTATIYLLLQLQHAAAAAGITLISHQIISPVDEDPYARIIIDGQKLPEILVAVQRIGNWVVRDDMLTLDVEAITVDLVRKLLVTLGPGKP